MAPSALSLDVSLLKKTAAAVFRKRDKAGTTDELTPRKLREEVAELLGLEDPSVIHVPEYNKLLKEAALAEADLIEIEKTVEQETDKPKKKRKSKKHDETVYKSAEFVQNTSDVEPFSDTQPPASGVAPIQSLKKKKKRALPKEDGEDEDEPPKRRKSSPIEVDSDSDASGDHKPLESKSSKTKVAPKKHKSKSSNDPSSKDEAAVKRLKAIVLACGIRKIWFKEFSTLKDPSSTSQQTKYIKNLLISLGMDGRVSIEKAKALREKRELAQELEDVRTFNDKINANSSRARRSTSGKTKTKALDSDSDSDAGDIAPTRPSNTARRSIQAFLGDDSDD